jgi:hypothetical protein
MDIFDVLADPDLRSLDPGGGVLVITTYWRPRSGDPNPEQPGEKLFILSYLPTPTVVDDWRDRFDVCNGRAVRELDAHVASMTKPGDR